MSEDLDINVKGGQSARDLADALRDVGTAGSVAAEQIRNSFRKAMDEQAEYSTTAAEQARIAMNSWKIAEAEKAAAARETARQQAAAAKEAAAAEKSAAKEAAASVKAAKKEEASAAKQAAKEMAEAAKQAAAAEASAVKEALLKETAARKAATAEQRALLKQQALEKKEQSNQASTGGAFVTGLVAYYGIKEAVKDFAELSDSMQNARNRLAVVSGSQTEAAGTLLKLKDTAIATRGEFDLTVRTYTRLAAADKALKINQSENITMTRVLQQAVAVGGSTAEEAHATLIQLSQAFASNRLSGDEFRSVAEQMPAILDMIANATGKPRDKLKELGQQGKLTAAVMAYSILNATDAMGKKFDMTMPTIEQAWTNLSTEVRFAIDNFNQTTGASQTLVTTLQMLSMHLNDIGRAVTDLGIIALPLVVLKIGELGLALKALALENPFGLMAVSVGLLAAALHETLPDYKAFFTGPEGHAMSKAEIDQFKRAHQQSDGPQTQRDVFMYGANEYTKAQQTADTQRAIDQSHLKKLHDQAMADINGPGKAKRHRRPPTFEDAVSNLEEDVGEGTFNKAQRRDLDEVMKVQDKLNGSLRIGDKGYKLLTEDQYEYVVSLTRSKKAQQDSEATNKALFQYEMQRYDERKNARIAWQKMLLDQEELQNKIDRDLSGWADNPTQTFDWQNDPRSRRLARQRITELDKNGTLDPSTAQQARDKLEMNESNITPVRKQFLEETTGLGKTKQDIDSIFGPDGSIATGFSHAISQSIVFHDSFKTAIKDLGKTIEAEILQTLVQGLIRMAILSALGGGNPTKILGAVAGSSMTEPNGFPLTGRAQGGYVSGPRTRIMGYHHGGEYIVNAAATDQNRDVLEAINSGKYVAGGQSGGAMNVTIHNHSGASITTRQTGPNDMMIMVARQVLAQEGPKMVAGTMSDANSHMSKNLAKNFNVQRSR